MTTKTKRIPLFLIVLYVVYSLYYFADMNTSANTMVKQTESRSDVHVYLIVLIVLLGVFFLSRGKWRLEDPFRLSFLFMIVWTVVVDLIVGAQFWGTATHVGLLTLFYLIYFWAANYINTSRLYNLVLCAECILWIITIWYAIQAYFAFREYNGEDVDIVLNMSYNVLVFMPVLLQIKKRALKLPMVTISVLYIVVSLKRGAIITLLAMIFVYAMMSDKKKGIKTMQIDQKKAGKVIISLAAIAVLIIVVDDQMGGALSARFTLDALRYGSSRNELYSAAWNDVKTRGILFFLLGKGSGSSLQIIGSGVHNEILEFLFSYGLVGAMMYVVVVFNGAKRGAWLRNISSTSGRTFTMGMTYVVLVGVFGSALFSHMTFHIMLAMGMANSAGCEIADGRLPDGQQ